ncbi:MAG: SpoIID/LytB domain-containing protein [Lachnospiraceae bacterium]|nr:SpoIID/LytB domain-containing protein [Lachnospiraceae bacterium]
MITKDDILYVVFCCAENKGAVCLRKYWVHICIVAAALTVFLIYFMNLHRNWVESETMSRAQIARMLALMRYDMEELQTEESHPEWYGKYVDVVLREGWMKEDDSGDFHPTGYFTYGDLRYIMEAFHLSEDLLTFSMKYRQNDGRVSRNQWCEVYQLLCADSGKVRKACFGIYGSPANIMGLSPWQIVTDKGVKVAEGIPVEAYMNRQVEAYMSGDNLLCIIGETDGVPKLDNVWIESGENQNLHAFFYGWERDFDLSQKPDEKLEANMADLTFEDGHISSISYKTSRIQGRLTGIEEGIFIIDGYGEVPITENLAIYQIAPSPKQMRREELKIDDIVYDFVLEGDKICGVIYRDYAQESIRVLLHTSGNVYNQTEVWLTAEEPFTLTLGNEVKGYGAGEEVKIFSEDIGENEAVVKTESADGKIQILLLERSCGIPAYHGKICIQNYGGEMILINEVNLEDYVAGVIPGEMPVSYGVEALKVQAVCARTFGRKALESNFKGYPANLDDTVSSQVYNNQLECEESILVTQATRGQVLKNPEGLTSSYFFSTSCGHTSDPEDVWYCQGEEKDSKSVSVFLSDDSVSIELSKEEDFRKFINREDGYTYFEEDLPWFRWQTFLPASEIIQNVWNTCQVDIGTLERIEVAGRAESGLLKSIKVTGSDNQCNVYGEYQIRQVLSPKNAELIPQSGETVTGWALLPSAYCYLDAVIENNQCEGYLIHGGGYGHGSGMSQNGAMKMAEMGKEYKEILKYFFPDSEVVSE